MWRLFYDVETILLFEYFCAMLRRFYSVEDFLGCGDFSTKQRIFNEEKAFL